MDRVSCLDGRSRVNWGLIRLVHLILLLRRCQLSASESVRAEILEGSHFRKLTGENLTLTCHLTGAAGSVHDLYFTRGSESVENVTTMVTERSIVLDIESLRRDEHDGYYFCRLRNQAFPPLDDAMVEVGDPVEVVTSISCRSPGFEYMECSWCPDEFDNEIQTIWKLEFETRTSDGKQNCGHYPDPVRKCRCVFCPYYTSAYPRCNTTQFFKFTEYNMTVTAGNKFSTSTSEVITISTDGSIVEADPVRDPGVLNVTARSCHIHWVVPLTLEYLPTALEYRVNYSTNWTPTVSQIISDTFLHIPTIPATEYSISVEARPVSSSFWGETTIITVVTPEAAPDVGPEITNFRKGRCVDSQQDTCRRIAVFWKEVPVHDRNGVIQGYTVSVQPESFNGTGLFNETVAGGFYSYVREIESDASLQISVSASTAEGNSPPAVISIPTDSELLPLPVNLISETINSSHVILTWSNPDEHIEKVAVFTCKGQLGNSYSCQGDVDQVLVSADADQYVMASQSGEYVMSVSSIRRNQSSGLTPTWMCTYLHDGAVPDPKFYLTTNKDHITVNLDLPECSPNNGWARSLYYQMEYCNVLTCATEVFRIGNISIDVSEYIIRDLTAGTKYNISVKAVGSLGSSEWVTQTVLLLSEDPSLWLLTLLILLLVPLTCLICLCKKWCSKARDGVSIVVPVVDQSHMITKWLSQQTKVPSEVDQTEDKQFESTTGTGRTSVDSGHGDSVDERVILGESRSADLQNLSNYSCIDDELDNHTCTVSNSGENCSCHSSENYYHIHVEQDWSNSSLAPSELSDNSEVSNIERDSILDLGSTEMPSMENNGDEQDSALSDMSFEGCEERSASTNEDHTMKHTPLDDALRVSHQITIVIPENT